MSSTEYPIVFTQYASVFTEYKDYREQDEEEHELICVLKTFTQK